MIGGPAPPHRLSLPLHSRGVRLDPQASEVPSGAIGCGCSRGRCGVQGPRDDCDAGPRVEGCRGGPVGGLFGALANGAMSASRGFAAFAQQALPVLMYVAHFTPPPDGLEKLDRRMRTRLAHALYRAIPDEVLFNPLLVGFRDSPPAQLATHSTLMRVAARHSPVSRLELDRLLVERSIGGSLLALREPLSLGADLGWRSRAIADNNAAALQRLQSASGLGGAAGALAQVALPRSAIVAALRGEGSGERLVAQFVSRIVWWKEKIPEGSGELDTACEGIARLLHRIERVAPVYSFALVRKVCNAWTTTSRIRGDTLVCRSCRTAHDGVSHYLRCDPLWSAIERRTHGVPAVGIVARVALTRASPAYSNCTRFRPPPANLWQLTIAADVVRRASALPAPHLALTSLVQDVVRRHKL